MNLYEQKKRHLNTEKKLIDEKYSRNIYIKSKLKNTFFKSVR